MLFSKNGRGDTLAFEHVRVVDPVRGIDETLTVRIAEGTIAALEPTAGPSGGRILAPAFVDPHVHLRTPGREDEEDLASGTRAPRMTRSSLGACFE